MSVTTQVRRASPIHHTPPVSVDPTRQVAFARSNPVPAALWIFLVLFGLVALRNGALPSASQTLTWGMAAVIVVVSATVAPELVTALLLAALVLSVLTNVPLVTDLLGKFGNAADRLTSGINPTPFSGGA